MPVEVILPQLGESVIEGTVTKWLKKPGEPVEEHEPLLEVNTDKVDTEIPSPETGTLLEILVPAGTTVPAGAVLGRIARPGEALERGNAEQPAPPASPALEAASARQTPKAPNGQSHHPEQYLPAQTRQWGFISPVVAKMAREHHVDLSLVRGTGLNGRITKNDLLAYLSALEAQSPMPHPAPTDESIQPGEEATPPKARPSLPGPAFLPLTPVRRIIAERMLLSKQTSPHVTTVMEADMSRVVAHRQKNKEAYAQRGVNLTYTAYFVAAAAEALKACPMVNAAWSDAGILLHKEIHIGIAASLGEEGLIVPVLRNADSLSLMGLAQALNDLTSRARAHKLQPDEVKGGTFTITNHGVSGSLFATPIINQPQAAILGVGAIQKRVVVIEGGEAGDAIAIRPMVYLTLTFDHRILDGAAGDHFLGKVVETLEQWK